MPKQTRELSARAVKELKKPGLYAVGGATGLYLRVKPSGYRSWILRVVIAGKRRDVGLGRYSERKDGVSLSEARDKARQTRSEVEHGIDPIEARKARRAALLAAQAKVLLFAEAAERCHAAKSAEFRNAKHRQDWIASIRRYANPIIGDLSVAAIERAHVLAVLEPIWISKTETATRVRQRVEAVLSWATFAGYREGLNPARWAGNLEHALPKPSKVRKQRHFPALPWQDVGVFMAGLRQRQGIGARALEFAILTATRSGEVRGAVWDEIDLEAKLWTIPAERMKARKPHVIPLSVPAIKLLKALPRFDGVPYVFPSTRGKQLSDMTLSQITRRMEVNAVPHGFRSSFKDWARNATSFPDEVSELALAHVSTDATRAAYARDALLPKRTRLMRDWAKHCGTVPTKAKVTPIGERA